MIDHDEFTESKDSADQEELSHSKTDFRRVRLEAEFEYGPDWEGELQIGQETSDGDYYSVKELSTNYLGFDHIEVGFGREKIPFGMENTSSSRHLALIERSSASDAVRLGRGEGIWIYSGNKRYSLKAGYYNNSDWNDEVQNSIMRLTYAPYYKKDQQLHVGLSYSSRQWKDGNYRLTSNLEVSGADDRDVTASIDANKLQQAGLEFAAQSHGVIFQSEFSIQDIDINPGASTKGSQFHFIYFQLSWLPFDHYRRYRKGVFRQVKGKTGLTAWELVGRWSEVDGFDRNHGALIDTRTLGLNWYCYENTKLMINHVDQRFERPSNYFVQTSSAWSARLQWEFDL